jgi:ribosome-binding factor A
MSRRPERRYPRTARLNESVLEVLAEELERMSDPRLELVTLTGVDVTADLSRATVYFSKLGRAADSEVGDPTGEAAAALESAAPHLRAVLGRSIRIRQVPKLVFQVDPAIVSGQRIEALLREIHRDEAAGGS